MSAATEPLRFTLFTSFTPGGAPGTRWHHPQQIDFDFTSLDHWIRLAQSLEKAKWDGFFWADHSGVHDAYQDSWDTTVREAMQFPLGDPILLAAALASSTTNLGFAFTSNVIQDHPYSFARRLSTLDHLTNGRIAWNIVTSFQRSAWANLGFDTVAEHDARYERADEYVDVIYKLLEGSWEDDAVVRDTARRLWGDPAKIHEINHSGKHYKVPGIHIVNPSVQRLPVLFQAGSSGVGREFAARNAEGVFLTARSPAAAPKAIEDTRNRAIANGRLGSDIIFFQHFKIVLGATEEEAQRKNRELEEHLSTEEALAYYSAMLATDLSKLDLDTPIEDIPTNAMQSHAKLLAEAAPNKKSTLRDAVAYMLSDRFVGTPEQLADKLDEWRAAGVSGINVSFMGGIGDVQEFNEHACPVLQRRGLMQTEYVPGTLREKLFSGGPSRSGARINSRHPAARYRR